MPALKSLYINLQEEEQVDLIMRNLPNLEYLNGLPVDRDEEDEENEEPIVQNSSTAIQRELSGNVGLEVQELPEEEEESNQGYGSN